MTACDPTTMVHRILALDTTGRCACEAESHCRCGCDFWDCWCPTDDGCIHDESEETTWA